jgi:membrane dipeptidase
MHLIMDGHLDLAMNALEWNRDLTLPVYDIRKQETGMQDKPSMREGNVGLCVATQIARYVKPGNILPGWKSPCQAWAMTQGQLAWYECMEEAGQMVQITDREKLERHLLQWESSTTDKPVGYILSLEGADSIITPAYIEKAYKKGLRAVGPAHYGPGTYAQGTDAEGGITIKGRELIKEMERMNIILDATHLNDRSFWETMDLFHGPVWASHNNCRVFVPHNRQFSDEQIIELIRRDAVIGVALDAWMMVPGWVRGKSTPESMHVTLQLMADNIDHICQIAGNADHAAIGSDLDGAFGTEQCPSDIDTIADLQKLPDILQARGYKEKEIGNILSGNWIRFLRKNWKS